MKAVSVLLLLFLGFLGGWACYRPNPKGTPELVSTTYPFKPRLNLNKTTAELAADLKEEPQVILTEYQRKQRHPHPTRDLDRLVIYSLSAELGRTSDPQSWLKDLLKLETDVRDHDPRLAGRGYLQRYPATLPLSFPALQAPNASCALLESWAIQEPQKAARWLTQSSIRSFRGHSPLASLVKVDAPSVLNLLSGIDDPWMRSNREIEVLVSGLRSHPDAATKLTRGFALLPKRHSRNSILAHLYPEERGDEFRQRSPWDDRMRLAPIPTLNDYLQSPSEKTTIGQLINTGLEVDPETTFKWLVYEFPDDENRPKLITSALRTWVLKHEWAAVRTLSDSNGDYYPLLDSEQQGWVANCHRGYYPALPLPPDLTLPEMESWIYEQLEHAATSGETGRLIPMWASYFPEQAMSLYPKLSPEMAQLALLPFVRGIARNLPHHAARLVESSPDSPARDSALQLVAGSLAFRDPNAATAWANTLPAGTSQNYAHRNIVARRPFWTMEQESRPALFDFE